MQRSVPNTFANGRQQPQQQPQTAAMSLAQRIRNEQGPERARQFLIAMEPFLAPMERAHIAEQVGVQLPRPQEGGFTGGQQGFSQQNSANGNPFGGMNMPNMGNMGGMSNLGGTMQLMQMLSGLSGKPQQNAGGGGPDPMMMAQLLGGMMGKK